MNKPKKILELEKIYGIELEETQDAFIRTVPNTYQLNDRKEIIGLNLSGNNIIEIKGLENLTQLRTLYLSSNKINAIKGLENLTQLQTLYLSGNKITEIKGLESLTKLQELDLSVNQITQLKGLERLTKLQILYLASNQISEIKGLEELTQLQTLNLSSNQITKIQGLEKLRRLQKLKLYNNKISEIKGLDRLTQLQDVNLSSNKIQSIKDLKYIAGLKSLKTLTVDGNEFPEELSNLTLPEIREYISKHYSKPKEILELEKIYGIELREYEGEYEDEFIRDANTYRLNDRHEIIGLNLSGNEISEIKSLGNLTNLQSLDLFNNKIIEITSLENLTQLKVLYLSYNQILEINSLENLTQLQKLYLSSNQISEIKSLGNLTKLQTLDLFLNQISEIKNLENLAQLQTLDLSGNKISEIKELETIVQLESLDYLRINSNPLPEDFPLLKPDENHLQDVRTYLSQLKTSIPFILPAKVMFLGNHASGKSSFLHYLQKNKLPTEMESTEILNVQPYGKSDDNLPIAMIYDFGGQDYYHGLYRAFFSTDAINVLMWCNEYDKNDVREITAGNIYTCDFTRLYWLHQLQDAAKRRNSKGKEPVILVQTHADDTKNNNSERKNLGDNTFNCNIKDEFFVSMEASKLDDEAKRFNLSGLEYLKTSLLYEIEQKRKIKVKRPKYFGDFLRNVLDLAENNKEKCIPINALLLKYKEQTPEDLIYDLNQMALRGLVLYYRENEKIKDVVWLNPAETVKHIHTNILKHEIIRENNGVVNKNQFDDIFNDDDRKKIKELLLAEKVIFEDNSDMNNIRYIVPGYLPLFCEDNYHQILSFGMEKPDYVLKFKNFLPFGLINQLVCLYGAQPDYKKFWRDRLIFTFNGEYMILLALDFSNLEISVHIRPKNSSQTPKLSLDKMKKLVFINIIDLYNGDELEFLPDQKIKNKRNIRFIEAGKEEGEEWNTYIGREEIQSPKDMYLSVDGKHFICHFDLENSGKGNNDSQAKLFVENTLAVYTKTLQPTLKTQTVNLYKNFTNNQNISKMKKIFISYSREDVYYKDELKKYLELLNLFGIADHWSCERITIDTWHDQIQTELKESDLIIYMLSINFLSSKYILNKEVMEGLRQIKEENPNKKALCIIVRDFPSLQSFADTKNKDELSPVAQAILELSDWQYLPYVREKVGEGTGKLQTKECIIPLERYEYDGRTLSQAYSQITDKILEWLKR